MFQNPYSHQKQDKICSISNFSSSQNSEYLNEQEITAKLKNFTHLLKKNEQKPFQKPVFIISQNFKSKHINALTQMLEKNNIPMQFQYQTDSLGQELNTTFFVVVDNKNGPLSLGKQFNSVLMTIVGYPKIGNNKKNIYCQQPQQVFSQYKDFIKFKSRTSQNVEQKISKLKSQQSALKNGSNGFSILNSQVSGLKLKSISKYDKKKRENSLVKSSTRKFLASDIFKSEAWQNKENLTSIRDIYQDKHNLHNLYFIESTEDHTYNDMIGKYYHELKLSTSKKIEETVFYYRSDKQLIRKFNEVHLIMTSKSLKGNKNEKVNKVDDLSGKDSNKLHFIIISSQAALRLATRINCEFYAFKDKIRFIVVMLKQISSNDEDLDRQMLLVKKTIQSNLFQSLVCSPEQCQKALKSVGFNFKYDVPPIKVAPTQCKSILTKSCKKILGTEKMTKNEVISQKSDDIISFCPKLKWTVSIDQSKCESPVFKKSPKDQSELRPNSFQNKPEQFGVQKSNVSSPQSKIIIPPINSMLSSFLSPQKQSVSSNGSKIKIIRVLKKQPSNMSPSNNQQRGKSISQVNSEYCIKKNKSIVQKIQSKMGSSKHNLSTRKSQQSIESDHSQQQVSPKINTIGSDSSLQYSKSKVNSSKFISRKQLKNELKSSRHLVQNQYQHVKSPQTKKLRKLKLNLNSEDPFVAQCSKISCPDDNQSQASQKKIRKLKKQTPTNQLSANQYYFGSSLGHQKKWQQQVPLPKNQNLIDGLVHIEYNQLIASIVNEFKQNCPSSIIKKDSYKQFYLACEYSRQLKRLWRFSKQRSILPVLIDIQGLKQIYKYYSNVMYEDDELQFYSTLKDKISSQNEQYMQNTGNLTHVPNSSENNTHMLLFFTIVTQKEAGDHIFQRLDQISQRLPKHQMIKCVVEQQMTDNQSEQKAQQIYTQMLSYFNQLKQEYGDRFVQTA